MTQPAPRRVAAAHAGAQPSAENITQAGDQQPDTVTVSNYMATSTMFPGTEVTLPTPDGVEDLIVTVYPMGIRHLKQFIHNIEEVIPRIASQVDMGQLFKAKKRKVLDMGEGNAPVIDEQPDIMTMLLPIAVPILCTDLLDLLNECTIGLDLNEQYAPHWWMPMIAEVFVEESFGTEAKLRPWVEAVDNVIGRLLGESPGISEMLFKPASQPDTTSETF